jgi:hypothetical protein
MMVLSYERGTRPLRGLTTVSLKSLAADMIRSSGVGRFGCAALHSTSMFVGSPFDA